MRKGHNGIGEDPGTTVGFGRLAYDPITKTFWYYGIGVATDQGGTYIGPMNFGTKSLEDLVNHLKYNLQEAQPTIERLTQERVDERNDKGPV
jgi:hypothetical protein